MKHDITKPYNGKTIQKYHGNHNIIFIYINWSFPLLSATAFYVRFFIKLIIFDIGVFLNS